MLPTATLEVLPNGLKLVLVPDDHVESVCFGLFVESGSRHELPEYAGISHFIEHMLFKGTKTRSALEISQAIEGRGGNFNAYTSEESTCFFAYMPYDALPTAVDIICDMYANPAIPDSEFERERHVVLEEIKMYGDEPDSVAMENLQRALFPRSALGAPVAGTPESLKAMRPTDLRRYIKSHYLPSNTVVVIVGNFDEGKALKLVGAAFGVHRRKSTAIGCDRASTGKPIASVTASKDIAQTQLALGYRTFGIADGRKYAATVMDAILGRGMSSRLFQEVREKRGLSYDISSRMQFFQDAGMFTVTAGLDPRRAKETLATVERELKRVCEKPVPAAELKRTKDFLIGNFRLSHEKVTSKMFFYGQTMLFFGRLVSPQEQVEGIRAVTAADVKAAARAILRPCNRSVSWVVPK